MASFFDDPPHKVGVPEIKSLPFSRLFDGAPQILRDAVRIAARVLLTAAWWAGQARKPRSRSNNFFLRAAPQRYPLTAPS